MLLYIKSDEMIIYGIKFIAYKMNVCEDDEEKEREEERAEREIVLHGYKDDYKVK